MNDLPSVITGLVPVIHHTMGQQEMDYRDKRGKDGGKYGKPRNLPL